MNALLQKASDVKKNGAINGRSLPYYDLSEDARVRLAADAVTAVSRYVPSIKSAARDFETTPAKISAELDHRAARHRVEQVKKLAEAFRCLPAHLRDAVIQTAGVGIVWDSLDRLTR
jgi:hypothetical protein